MAEEKQTNYDVIVVGAGPAGMTAALYASRANLSVLMLDRGIYGGNLNNTAIENYPGFKTVQGPELAQDMYQGRRSLVPNMLMVRLKKLSLQAI